jgi:rhomboid protease GluP
LSEIIPPEQENQTPAPAFSDPDVAALPDYPPADQPQQHFTVVVPQRKPILTYVLIGLTVLVFLAQFLTDAVYGVDLPVSIGIKYNPLIDQGQYWRLFTPALLHGDILHIAFNLYALYILGRGIEVFYGHTRFLLLYIASAFAGATASYLLTAAPSLGASTATFGLLAAYGVLGYRNQKVFGSQAKRIVQQVVQVGLINFALGLTPGIDNWGHFGGALGGFVLSWFGGPLLELVPKGRELHLENRRTTVEFVVGFIVVFGLTAALAILLDGKAQPVSVIPLI